MKKFVVFFGIVVILVIAIFLSYSLFLGKDIKKENNNFLKNNINTMEENTPLKNKKIAMIIAFRDFRDEEYFVPKGILEKAGAEILTASTATGTAIGADGGETKVDILLTDLNLDELDAVLFVGGPGCLKYLDKEDSYDLLKEVVAKNKTLGSICISPVILAKAGVLKGKRATVWSSVLDKSSIRILEENGAIYEDKPVVIDGKIVTANGPAAASEFAQAVIKVLTTN
ncbi:DJ-1/PfpI family protein [bacterium]|nr:DJ-1/PfpI family protein [bacterium]